MTSIIRVAPNNPYGTQIAQAAAQLRSAIAKLEELNGLRDQAISAGDNAVTMQNIFGVTSPEDAQALSDRWSSLLDVIFNPNSAAFGNFVYLRDFMNNVITDV